MSGALTIVGGRLEAVVTRVLRQIKPNVRVGPSERFVVADHFLEDRSDSAKIKIDSLSCVFRSCLLPLIEPPVPGCDLAPYSIERLTDDTELFQELAETKPVYLSQVHQLLENQPHGEGGPLLTNHAQTIFPVRCVHGEILPVCLSYWFDPGAWQIFSVRHGHAERQFPGAQIIVPAF